MKISVLLAISLLLLTGGCAYEAYNKYNACMRHCYEHNPVYEPDDGQPPEFPPVTTDNDMNPFTWVYFLQLLDSCKKSCGLDTEDESER